MAADEPGADDAWEREQAEEEADRQRKAEPPPALGRAEFLAWRSPRLVGANPTRLDNPLWHWMVRTRWNAFRANELFGGPSAFDAGPMWCFDRFGKSETSLGDGRVLHIAGEHEDHYDPDFHIYNDVTVVDADGGVAIFGYPQADFAPTDFPTATRVGQAVWIIGRLGNPDGRVHDATPVYRLCLASMRIEAVAATGEPPGWIYRHTATLSADGRAIVVAGGERWLGTDVATRRNIDTWALDTHSAAWHRLTRHAWQHWVMVRTDRKPNRLWDTRQEQWRLANPHPAFTSHWPDSDEPDLAALDGLYRVSGPCGPLVEGTDSGAFSTVIDGLTVRFLEDRFWVEAVVEGQLGSSRLAELQAAMLVHLERIDRAPYEIEGGGPGVAGAGG